MNTLSLTSRVGALLALVAIMSCSRNAENSRSMAAPTSPSSLGAGQGFIDPGGDRFGAMDATFPAPEDALAFRQVLESKFRAEGRPIQTTFVNAEGVTVWTLEYLRYRSSGCTQAEAVDKVFAQIDRRGIPPLCSSSTSETLPPQSESLAFRQLLEVKYRDQLGAPPTQTYVDQPNEMLYTIEFVRYTQSGCSSASAYERVFVQIDNRGVEPDCRPTPPSCSYGLSPSSQNAAASAGSFNAAVTAEPSACTWQAGADVSWITIPAPSGTGSRAIAYAVAVNPSTQSRTGRVTVVGSDGSQTSLQVTQAGSPTNGPGPVTCTYALSPSPLNAISDGGTYDVQVTAPAGCAWTAGSSASFVTVVSGATGTGNGTFRLRVDGNPGDTRQGTVELRYSGGVTTLLVSQTAGLPRAIINAPLRCAVTTNCTFDGSASTGVITSYQWNFGDNSSGTGATVTHVYPRSYVSNDSDFSIDTTVTLTVTGPRGTSTATATVTVFDVPPNGNVSAAVPLRPRAVSGAPARRPPPR